MNSRDKGARGERAVANFLKTYGYKARRGQQFHGGADSPDVVGLPNIHIEVKFVEQLRLQQAYEQSFRDAGDGEIPTVWHKRNREPLMVTLTAEDFMRIYMASQYCREQTRDPYADMANGMLE
jgi:hypothetical protein